MMSFNIIKVFAKLIWKKDFAANDISANGSCSTEKNMAKAALE